jgi:hypothetical protein
MKRDKASTINGVPMACCSQIFDDHFMERNFPRSCKRKKEDDYNNMSITNISIPIPKGKTMISISNIIINK